MASPFTAIVNQMDNNAIKILGGVVTTFTPQDNSGSQTVNGLIANPAMFEDYTPGSTTGTDVIRLFVRFANISPQPQKGDVFVVNGITYMVQEGTADVEGGAILKLRAT